MPTSPFRKHRASPHRAAAGFSILLAASLLTPGAAADGGGSSEPSPMTIPKDSLWGAVIGAIVAGSINLIADKEAVRYGPSIGVGALVGTAWGIYEYVDGRKSRAVALDPRAAASLSDVGAGRGPGRPMFRFELYGRAF